MDLLLRGGTVVDGTGAPSRTADVAVDGGRVVDVGEIDSVDSRGARVVDAEGMVVAPGFVDVHVHYDAQVLWDPLLAPSTLHGVTTMIGGNCGFTLGQAGPDQSDYLVRMLARVEGIPLETLQAAVDWTWHDTAGYLDRIDGHLGPNIGFLAGHSTIRRAVMGDRAIGDTATERDLEEMERVLHEALDAGALGFSSSNAETHNDGAGDPVPSRFANEVELFRLCRAVAAHEGTTLEHIPARASDEMARMASMSLAARRPLCWNILQVGAARVDDLRSDLAASTYADGLGAIVRGLTLPGLSEQRLTLRTGFIFDALPGWDTVFKLPIEERKAAFADPVVRQQLQRGAELAGARRAEVRDWAAHRVAEAFAPEVRDLTGRTVGEIAAARGTSPLDTMLDIAIADDLNTVFMPRPIGDDDESWTLRLDAWRNENVIVGASDAGAHMDMLATFGFATTMLRAAVHDRALLPLEEAIRLLTDWPARHFGLRDRGRVEPGFHADLVVFDPARVGPGTVRTRYDLPAGAGRLFSAAEGIGCVVVNGRVLVQDGEPTGDLPGTLLRAGRDTETIVPAGARRVAPPVPAARAAGGMPRAELDTIGATGEDASRGWGVEARRGRPPRRSTPMALDGKVALVTGASRGIGKAIALELAREGADVVVAARTVEPRSKLPGTIGETVAAIEALGRRALPVATDVSRAADLDALVDSATSTFGRVDVLVNNAAYTSGHALTQPAAELTREDWELQFATNVHAPFSLIKAIAPHMIDQGGGVVVNITSRAYEMQPVGGDRGAFGGAGPWAYGASKAALNRMTNAFAAQLWEHDVAVIALEPGFVRTEFVDLMSERGAFDATKAVPTSVPARVVSHLAASGNAMQYSGQVVSAPVLHAELGL